MPSKENITYLALIENMQQQLDRKKKCDDGNVLKRMAYMDKMNIWNGHENITR